MGEVRSGVPLDLAVRLRDRLRLGAAVETGTHMGDSAAQLAQAFGSVWTVELSEHFYEAARDRHRNIANISFVLGDSAVELARLASALTGPALYWLDGHWSGGMTAGETRECPVLDEVVAIDASPHAADSAILIDDARLFFGPPPPPHRREQWPTFLEVADALRATHSRYVTVLEDVVIAVPTAARSTVEEYWLDQLSQHASGRPKGSAFLSRLRRKLN